jgi:hypothetical protein
MAKTKMTSVVFSPEEVALLASEAYAVWDECAYDVLTAVAEDKGKTIERVTVSRAVAMEIALDAGRLEERLGGRRGIASRSVSSDLLDRWERADYEQKKATVRSAFSYTRYGL